MILKMKIILVLENQIALGVINTLKQICYVIHFNE